jgi:hypothetical protein
VRGAHPHPNRLAGGVTQLGAAPPLPPGLPLVVISKTEPFPLASPTS